MTTDQIRSAVNSALEGRNPARSLRECLDSAGERAVFAVLDEYLGDYPAGQQIRKTAIALDLPEADLRILADSPEDAKRRISRLLLLEQTAGLTEDSILQKGLSDKSSEIRCDAARFTGTGSDRTRLYNQLIRLVREDPDSRVRRSAGKRLAESFADLYAVDFDGLPPLSRMLIIDALEGHSRIDEERAEALLSDKPDEASFRAARALQKWGTLRKLLNTGSSAAVEILKKAAAQGVADYLEGIDVSDSNREIVIDLAGRAGRDDLVRRFAGTEGRPESVENSIPPALLEIEKTVMNIAGRKKSEWKKQIGELPVEDPGFRKAVEKAFPPPDHDIGSEVLFEIAREGQWKEWSDRITAAMNSGDYGIRCSAAAALGQLDPDRALNILPPYLMDRSESVRTAAAAALASMPSGNGCPVLGEYLKDEPLEPNRNSIIDGIRVSGGAALARCILDNWELTGAEGAGELLQNGVDGIGVELLADGLADEGDLTELLKHSGFEGGMSLLSAWPSLDRNTRKRFCSCLSASLWANSIPEHLADEKKSRSGRLTGALRQLNHDELELLLRETLESADGRSRRLLRRFMKS